MSQSRSGRRYSFFKPRFFIRIRYDAACLQALPILCFFYGYIAYFFKAQAAPANIPVNDGEAVSVPDVKIWDIRKMGEGSYEVDLTVDQKKGDAIARGTYSVNVYREGGSYVIASLPFTTSVSFTVTVSMAVKFL